MADISASNWNEADAGNSAAAPDGAPEGMAPSGLNDVLRAHQGAIKRWYGWTIPRVTAGTSTAYTLAYTVAPGALVDGMTHLVEFHTTNGAAATLNVNALGAIPLYYYSGGLWRAVPPGLFEGTEVVRVAYHASSGAYRVMNPGAEKTGTVKAFAGSTVPGGYLLCFGQAVSRTAYGGLFNVLGTAYGAGDGSTTFNLPDLRGRVAAGKDDMGGSAANRITGTTVPNSPQLGAVGGQETVTASVFGSATGTVAGNTGGPNSTHGVDDAAPSANVADFGHGHSFSVSATLTLSGATTAAATNVQPTIILNQMIRI